MSVIPEGKKKRKLALSSSKKLEETKDKEKYIKLRFHGKEKKAELPRREDSPKHRDQLPAVRRCCAARRSWVLCLYAFQPIYQTRLSNSRTRFRIRQPRDRFPRAGGRRYADLPEPERGTAAAGLLSSPIFLAISSALLSGLD